MKKQVLVFLAVVLLAAVIHLGGWSWSKGYESQKSAAGLNITLTADRYPLVEGDNNLALKVNDSSGIAVTDAKVDIHFFMPPMPGMAPMEERIQPQQKGTEYSFTVNVAMKGGWKVEATVTQLGKAPATPTFNVEAG